MKYKTAGIERRRRFSFDGKLPKINSNREFISHHLDRSHVSIRLSRKELTEAFVKPIITLQHEQVVVSIEDPLPTTDAILLHQCLICLTESPLDNFTGLFSDLCAHVERSVCNKCLYEHTKCWAEDWNLLEEPIPCPEKDCPGRFEFQGIREILIKLGQNTELFHQYESRLVQRSLEHMDEFIWCAHGCGSGQLHGFDVNENPVVDCVKCQQKTCFKHRIRWHTDLSCDEYDVQNGTLTGDEATDRWLDRFTKLCPRCEYHIQKLEGCDHMTCRYCKHEFCWECFADYRAIAEHGSSAHEATCSYYQVIILRKIVTAFDSEESLVLTFPSSIGPST